MTQDNLALNDNKVIDTPIQDVLSDKYLSYALSTIMSRSLPDVRDGLKPVHRRILYAMRQLRLRSEGMPKKSARVVGDVIGKFHPHGDAAVYDAMVRLAQDFAARYPLVYGQGNFGNIDGDNAAAMRYTEAKMTAVAELLLEELDEDTVDFRETYDGDGKEPIVLPAKFPNLLANGATGIAVGMATSIPPHNVVEICNALTRLIEKKSLSVEEIVELIPGPDLPTGGLLVEDKANIIEAYKTGKGSFRVRAKWHTEDTGQGTYQIIVTEIPYQVQKSNLVEKIADLMDAKKLPLVDDIHDESAEDIRLVIVPKSRNVDPKVLMATLFRHTPMENRVSLNMNVLDNGVRPEVMSIKDILQSFLDHRHQVLIRRSQYRLNKIDDRLEVLEGYLVAYLNLDEVIKIIRTEDKPKETLIERFELTERQAEAILNMKLRALHKLQEIEIKDERDGLLTDREALIEILENEKERWKVIKSEIKDVRERFAGHEILGQRRTEIGEPEEILEEVPLEAVIEREPITVLCSKQGWIKSLKGHVKDVSDQKYKDGDEEGQVLQCETTDKILVFSSSGRMFTVQANEIPGGRGYGEPIKIMLGLADESEIINIMKYNAEDKLFVASSDGRGFIVQAENCLAQTRNGKMVLSIPKGKAARVCSLIDSGHDHVAVIGENRKLLIFSMDEVNEMQKGRGIILQRYRDGGLSDVQTFKLEEGLVWKHGAGERVEHALTAWIGKRAQAGRMAPHGFPRSNKFEV